MKLIILRMFLKIIIKVGSVKCEDEKDEINLLLNKLIKFNLLTISNRLIIEKDNELFLEAYLEQ